MLTKSSSTSTLIRSDSGIDIASVDGVTLNNYRDSQLSISTSVDSSSSPTSSDDVTEPVTWWRKVWPPKGPVAKWFTWLVVLGVFFGALWALSPDKFKPGESEFGLVVTLLLCFAAEALFVKIPTPEGFPSLPPLLASLLMGIALNNLPPPLNIASYIFPHVSHILREIGLVIILTEAGLEIDPEAMMKVKWAVCRLAFLPCIGETTIIGILAHFILGFPFIWSFMMGFMIAAVSPAVVIPSLSLLQEKGLGVAKGIPSLVMAASGIDDVLAIAGFTILLGIAMPSGFEEEIIGNMATTFGVSYLMHPPTTISPNTATGNMNHTIRTSTTAPTSQTITGNMTHSMSSPTPAPTPETNVGIEIAGALVEIVIGIVTGLFLGYFISIFPHSQMKYKTFCHGFLLLSLGILFVFGTSVWGIPGAGSLCALIMSFVASIRWGKEKEPLGHAWQYMWKVFQPILFGLTGTLVRFDEMDGAKVGLGLAVLSCAIFVRLVVSTSVTFGLNLKLKEKLFISIAWIPKGTVQAALGSAALEQARRTNGTPDEISWGTQILVLAVLITLITAPLGSFGISLAGPRFLSANSRAPLTGEDNPGFGRQTSCSSILSTATSNGDLQNYFSGLPLPQHHHHNHHHHHFHGLELKLKDPDLDEIREESDSESNPNEASA